MAIRKYLSLQKTLFLVSLSACLVWIQPAPGSSQVSGKSPAPPPDEDRIELSTKDLSPEVRELLF